MLTNCLATNALPAFGAQRSGLPQTFDPASFEQGGSATGDAGGAIPNVARHRRNRTAPSPVNTRVEVHPKQSITRRIVNLLCRPLIKQARLAGLLYLENRLTSYAFAPDRIAILKLLAAQAAAISLENTRLYSELQEREAKIRRLVDANIIGIFVWETEGRILEANDAFLRTVGYDREDLISSHVRWPDLTPPGWLDDTAQRIAEVMDTGTAQPREKEFLRKDGSCVPVLIGGARLEEGGNQGLAFVLDLTERKRAEAEARQMERRFSELQSELAHANRLATMGQLTASIAHEVKQPIGATVTNAQVALRFLDSRSFDLGEIRQIFEDIVKDGIRASEVFDRMRNLTRKAPARRDRIEINSAIREVIELTRGEATENCVTVHAELADGLPLIEGDRVQLQQVMLNLIINAIQAMGRVAADKRELCICSERTESEEVRVAVRDSGPGLSSDNIEHLFEPFYTTKSDGMGMGLSICRSIVEAHGGQLIAIANAPNGAVFQFTVPVRRAA
jgi:PAS domain S-box-containing protein